MWPFKKSPRQLAREAAKKIAAEAVREAAELHEKNRQANNAKAEELAKATGGHIRSNDGWYECIPAPVVVVEIEPAHCEAFYALLDGAASSSEAEGYLARYRLWLWVESTYPQCVGKPMLLTLKLGRTRPVLEEDQSGGRAEWDPEHRDYRYVSQRSPGLYRHKRGH